MTTQTIINALIIVVLIGFIGVRQMTWRPVAVASMWRMPLVLGAVGVFLVAGQTKGVTVTAFDAAVLAVELVISLGAGVLMGTIARFRALPRSEEQGAPEFESRTGFLGLVLWLIVIGVRVGLDIWAGHAGSVIVTSTGVILVMIAANRVARVAVFASRVAKLDSVAV